VRIGGHFAIVDVSYPVFLHAISVLSTSVAASPVRTFALKGSRSLDGAGDGSCPGAINPSGSRQQCLWQAARIFIHCFNKEPRMTCSRTIFALTLIGAMLAATSAWAQADEEPTNAKIGQNLASPGDSGLDLLRMEEVRHEVKITEDQERKFLGMSDEAQNPREMRKKALALLAPEQRERLKQIRLQVLGPAALGDPEIARILELTEEQRQSFKALPGKVRQATRKALREAGNLTADQQEEKAAEVRKKILKTALETLTTEQRDKFEKLKGPKFEADCVEVLQP
jgi:Spy/CpxP family protein refolding chaperone